MSSNGRRLHFQFFTAVNPVDLVLFDASNDPRWVIRHQQSIMSDLCGSHKCFPIVVINRKKRTDSLKEPQRKKMANLFCHMQITLLRSDIDLFVGISLKSTDDDANADADNDDGGFNRKKNPNNFFSLVFFLLCCCC